MAKENKEKKHTVSLTEQEIKADIGAIERDENFTLFMRVQEGARLADKREAFIKLLEED